MHWGKVVWYSLHDSDREDYWKFEWTRRLVAFEYGL